MELTVSIKKHSHLAATVKTTEEKHQSRPPHKELERVVQKNNPVQEQIMKIINSKF
jgi:hypothetical protein